MISIKRQDMPGRRLCALIGAVLAVAAAGPSMALAASAGQHQPGKTRGAQQMQPPINAQTDPAAAAAAIQAGGSASNINWQTGTDPGGCEGAVPAPAAPVQAAPCVPAQNNQAHYAITDGWGTPAVFGDVLYNCSQTATAETDAGVSDKRTESWSLSEKVSLKISVGVPNIVSVSDEVSAFSKQANSSSTQVTVKNGVTVAPGWKGWTTIQVKTIMVPGTAYVTDPLRDTVTPVDDIDLSFPGYKANPAEQETSYTGHSIQMTANEIQTICNTNPVNVAARRVRVVGTGLTVHKPSSFVLRVCGPTGPCRAHAVTGPLPPSRIRRATARLTRAGHTYGWGTYIRGHTQLRASRTLRPGAYRLILTERPRRADPRERHEIETVLPVTISPQTTT